MHERCFATAVDFSSAWLEEMEVMQWRCSVDSPPSPFQTPQYSTSDSFFGWRNVAPLIRDSCRASQVWLNPNNFSETREQKYAGLELWSIFKEIPVHACRIWELNLWGDNKKHHQPEWVLCSLLGIPVTICKLSTKGLIRLGFVRPQQTGVSRPQQVVTDPWDSPQSQQAFCKSRSASGTQSVMWYWWPLVFQKK